MKFRRIKKLSAAALSILLIITMLPLNTFAVANQGAAEVLQEAEAASPLGTLPENPGAAAEGATLAPSDPASPDPAGAVPADPSGQESAPNSASDPAAPDPAGVQPPLFTKPVYYNVFCPKVQFRAADSVSLLPLVNPRPL